MPIDGAPVRGMIPEVESLRGIAIALVVLYHVDILTGGQALATPGQTSLLGAFLHGGHTGVSLFFVLSGFLLARPFLAEAAGGARVARRSYFARRALRILPLYVVVVVIASIRCAVQPADLLRGIPYLLFLNAFPHATTQLVPYSDPWWSLATEVQFYLLLPVVAWLCRWPRGRRLVGVLGVLWVAAYVGTVTDWVGTGTVVGRITLYASVFGRGPLFVLGAGAACLLPRLRAQAGRAPRGVGDAVLVGALVGLAVLLRAVFAVSYIGAELSWQWWHLIEGVLWTVVLLVVTAAPLRAHAVVCNPLLGRLGLWSYSLYLVHFPMLWSACHRRGTLRPLLDAWHVPLGMRAVAGVVASVVLAALSYRLIERPFLDAGRHNH
jgi:peptidoglycan/LPS O-acetylase OafA/YrhL